MLTLKTPREIQFDIAERAKLCRLELNLTQSGLAKRSGVSLGSIKRFELTGEISLNSLLKLAIVLENLDTFDIVFTKKRPKVTLDEIIKAKKTPKRGRVK